MSRKEIAKLIPTLSLTMQSMGRTHSLNCRVCLSVRKQQVDKCARTKRQFSTRIPFQTAGPFIQHCKSFKNTDSLLLNRKRLLSSAHYTVSATEPDNPGSGNHFIECSDLETRGILSKDMQVIFDFISEEEEKQLVEETEPYLKRLRYENSHWDDAIHGYRETERKIWSEQNKTIIQRVRDIAFPPGTPQLAYVHVLDLKKEGYIKPHVDAVKFCGNTIAGISLLSPSIMRLIHTEDKTKFGDIFLGRRSLYIMRDSARYNYTHEILPDESKFRGKTVQKDRRISVICRNEP